MKNNVEMAYEQFGFLVCGPWRGEVMGAAVEKVYDCLGNASVAFDNMIYEQLGMSADDIMEMLDMDDILLS